MLDVFYFFIVVLAGVIGITFLTFDILYKKVPFFVMFIANIIVGGIYGYIVIELFMKALSCKC